MNIAVVGGGSWGTALAIHLARAGHAVHLWAREPEVVDGIRREGRNPYYLTDIPCPAGLTATPDQAEAVAGAEIVLLAVPSEFFAATLKDLPPVGRGVPFVSAAKGLDPVRHARMTELIAERFPGAPVAALSGPTFAREVALGLPTACVVAGDPALTAHLQGVLGTREFRLYTNRDVVGVEIGGALKNVIAIATGLADGLGLGENARAALITRGLAEITRLAVAMGGQAATLAGLAGLGDLVLTCTGSLSRNRALGLALVRGETRDSVERRTRMVAEGARTVASAVALGERHRVTLPICVEVHRVLFGGTPPGQALAALLDRAAGAEDG
ncbi:MAG TPA: NAD(P)H-dependent glycerol-3-phosphate dehydrogenase [Candidatus Binatia bacterium]|nr:NAD(P)H-dependent glycerol-3-phosphate dehydrogenase [Candidatus Binatia bacterium]